MTEPTKEAREVAITSEDQEAAAIASGFDSWADAVYWSNMAKQDAVSKLARAFADYRQAALDKARADERARVVAWRDATMAVLAAVRDYLPPDGISAQDCLNRVIEAVDNPAINPIISEHEDA